jgi:hypothetical protein
VADLKSKTISWPSKRLARCRDEVRVIVRSFWFVHSFVRRKRRRRRGRRNDEGKMTRDKKK